MKFTKILGLVAMAAVALMAFAGTASATTLKTNGVTQTGAVTLIGSLKSGTSALLKDTSGAFANTCTSSKVEGTTSVFTGTTVSGNIKDETVEGKTVVGLSFSSCTHSPVVVHKGGSLSVEVIGSGPNGTVRSTGAEVTVPATILGSVVTVTCVTSNTDLGTLTGSSTSGVSATIDINAVLNCGSFLPSAKWEGTYVTTTSTGGGHAISVGA